MIKTINNILALLTRKEKIRMFWLFGAITVMAVMEVVGVASIMPFIAVISNRNAIEESSVLNHLYLLLQFTSYNEFVIFLGIVVLASVLICNAFTALTTWRLLSFTYMRAFTLSKRLLSDYVDRPYVFYLNHNSSDLGKNVLAEVTQVVTGVMVPGMEMIAKVVVIIFILTFLIIMNPVVAGSVIAIIGGAYAVVYLLLHKLLVNVGSVRLSTNKERYQSVAEIFGGIKDIKLMDRAGEFISRYSNSTLQYSKANVTHQVVSQLPRYVFESIVFGGMLIIILYHLGIKQSLGTILPVIALYAFAGYRLIPAMQQIFRSLTQIRFNLPAVDMLYNDIHWRDTNIEEERDDEETLPEISFSRSIELNDISYKYPDCAEYAVSKVELSVKKNQMIAFVGPTGSGKTTLVDIMLGFLRANEGKISVDGTNIDRRSLKVWQKHMGYVPQHIHISDDTVMRNIAFGIPDAQIDKEAVFNAAEIANIHGFIMDMKDGYETMVGERGIRLSGGERQRIGIARALYHDPDILVMDEATSALDGITEQAVMDAINNLAHKKTLILVAHRLTTVKDCDMIYLLENGRIVARGTYDELLENNRRFSAMAGVTA